MIIKSFQIASESEASQNFILETNKNVDLLNIYIKYALWLPYCKKEALFRQPIHYLPFHVSYSNQDFIHL